MSNERADSTEEKPRWQHRLDNFSRAFLLLREAIEAMEERDLTQLEKEGVVQRFEYCWELAWKALKDFLEFEGVQLESTTPRSVLKAAFAMGVIDRGDDWMAALDARNKMAHVYNFRVFEQVIADIRQRYLALFDSLWTMLTERALLRSESRGDVA